MKPVWLLDIDGVINAWAPTPPYDSWPEWTTVDVSSGQHTYPIQTAHAVRDFIIRVHEEDLAEIRWHTTWQHDANRVGAATGLPGFPVFPAPEVEMWRYRNSSDWKVPPVFRLMAEEDRPVLWTDDDINYLLTPAQQKSLTNLGCSLVVPNGNLGLVQHDLDRIEEFLQDCKEARNGA